jgi:hypothetical protein
MLAVIVKELQKTLKDIEADKARTRKNLETAVRIEGFRLMWRLKKELEEGRAGANVFNPLTEIAKRMGKPVNRKPLSKLAVAVRCSAGRMRGTFMVSVGFLDTGTRAISKSWRRIVEKQQEGATTSFTEDRRRAILNVGTTTRKRGDKAAKYFFLRKSTTSFRTPPRPILEPFIASQKSNIEANIVQNFERKMKGERI